MKPLIISIIIPTLDSAYILEKFFKHLNKQDYPKRKIEIIAADGGSKDNTVAMLRMNKVKVLKNPGIFADIGVSVAMKQAKGDLMTVLAVDNFLKDKKSLSKIAAAFDNEDIIAAFPKHESDNSDNFMTRYVNRFTDPFNHFVYGYAANARSFDNVYKKIFNDNICTVYDFSSSKQKPLIAFAQGFTVRGGFLKKRKHEYDDLLPVLDIIMKRKKIAYVHSVSVYHHTIQNVGHFVRKQKWATKNYLEKKNYGLYGREKYLSIEQKNRIKIWPFYVCSIILPVFYALYKLVKDREILWIYHPILCYLSLYSSGTTAISHYLKKKYNG